MKPAVTRLRDMQPGQLGDCFVLLAAKERGTTRDGKPYYRVTFTDAERSATAMIWSDSEWFEQCEQQWEVNRCYKIRCLYRHTQYGPEVQIQLIREATEADREQGFDPNELLPGSRFDPDEMFNELLELVEQHVGDAAVRKLVLKLLKENESEIKLSAAAARYHHAFRGGYLEHTLSVARTAVYLADKYAAYYPDLEPPLSKSLVVAGAVLHDIGKLRELKTLPAGADYTAAGRLVGHVLLGRDMVREAALTIPELDEETRLRLEHIVVSHQNLSEWGSPIPPRTPEALLVYFADDIDAKFYEMAEALYQAKGSDEEFTGRDNALRRRIFRGLKPSENASSKAAASTFSQSEPDSERNSDAV